MINITDTINSIINDLNDDYKIAFNNMQISQKRKENPNFLCDVDIFFQEQVVINFINSVLVNLISSDISKSSIEESLLLIENRLFLNENRFFYIDKIKNEYTIYCVSNNLIESSQQLLYFKNQIKCVNIEKKYCIKILNNLKNINIKILPV